MMELNEFPKEVFVALNPDSNDETTIDYLEGRLILNYHEAEYSVEVDIVQKESKKIYSHIAVVTNIQSEKEAIESGLLKLKQYFLKISQ